jgi:hypothetical protein
MYGVTGSGAGNEDGDFAWTKDLSSPSKGIITVSTPGDRFNLISLKVYTYFEAITITATAYRGGTQIGLNFINVLNTGNFETYELNFTNVDEVQFSAPTNEYAIDNLVVEPYPRPSAVTDAASAISATGATLNGTVNDNGAETTVSFDYGLTTGYGNSATATPATVSAGSIPVSATLSGLSCNTTYHFRVKGVSDAGTTNGSDQTFTTSACVPGAPTGVTATAGNGQASIAFSAPGNNGGAAITGYTVTSNPGNLTGTGAGSPITVSGLANGTSYTFTVTATNSAGTGLASSSSNSVTPKAPQTITFNNPGAQNFGTTPTLTATASSGLTPAFTSSTTGVCTITAGGDLTFVTVGTCTVNADQAGNGSYQAASTVSQSFTVNAVLPGAPIIGTATAGDAQASMSFSAPAFTGGAAITGYTATASPGGATGTSATSPITVTGLTNGQAYTFSVTATNSAGTGEASSASNSVTPKAPQTITFANPGAQNFGTTPTLTATSDSGLTVSFTSSTTGVCTITSGGALTFVTVGTCTINADQAGNASYLAANPVNRSFAVNAVVPGAPTIGAATAGDTQVSVSFSAPASNGGAAITGYAATSSPGGFTGTAGASPITITGLTNGATYTFTVTATNSVGTGSASASSNAVTPVPAAPIAGAVSITVAYGSDDNPVPLNLSGGAATSVAVAGAAGHGTATASGTSITYTPNAGYSGNDSFTYTASNLGGTSAPATVTITVNPDAPVAHDVAATVAYGSSDTPITLDISGGVATSVTIASAASHGTATASGTGITYTPDAGFAGADSFTYTASNAGGTSAAATVTITVSPQPGLVSEETVEEGESRFNETTIANVSVASGGTVLNNGIINNLDNAGTVTGGVVGGESVNSGLLDTVTISENGILDNLSGTIQNGTNNGAIYGGTIAGDIENNGLISGTATDGSEDPDYAVTIETGVVVTGGTLSGVIINRGTLTDVTITAGSHIVIEPGGAFTGAIALSDDTGVVTVFQIPPGVAFPAENVTSVEFNFQLLREYATDHDWDMASASANVTSQAENDLPALPDGYILVDGLIISQSGTWVGSAMPFSIPCREVYLPEDYDESDLAVLVYDPADGTWKEIAFEREDDAHLRITTDILSAYAVVLWEELDSNSGASGGGSGGCFIGLSASDVTMKAYGMEIGSLAILLMISLIAAFRKRKTTTA